MDFVIVYRDVGANAYGGVFVRALPKHGEYSSEDRVKFSLGFFRRFLVEYAIMVNLRIRWGRNSSPI
jgi:hypothetical protein